MRSRLQRGKRCCFIVWIKLGWGKSKVRLILCLTKTVRVALQSRTCACSLTDDTITEPGKSLSTILWVQIGVRKWLLVHAQTGCWEQLPSFHVCQDHFQPQSNNSTAARIAQSTEQHGAGTACLESAALLTKHKVREAALLMALCTQPDAPQSPHSIASYLLHIPLHCT